MAILFTLNDLQRYYRQGPGYKDFQAWALTVIDNAALKAKLQPSTIYYIYAEVQKLEQPKSHFYTTQAWERFLLYNSGGGSVDLCGSTVEAFVNCPVNGVQSFYNSFTSPSDLTNFVLLFYSARYSGSSSDWGTNAEILTVRMLNFIISDSPIVRDTFSVSKNGIASCNTFREPTTLSIRNWVVNPITSSTITFNGVTGSVSNGEITATATVQFGSTYTQYTWGGLTLNDIRNDIFYCRIYSKGANSQLIYYLNDGVNQRGASLSPNSDWTATSNYYQINYNATNFVQPRIQDNRASGWTQYMAKQPMVINLRESGLYTYLKNTYGYTLSQMITWIDNNIPFFQGTYSLKLDNFRVYKSGQTLANEIIEI